MPEDASIELSAVASGLTTGSARAMLAALIDGDRDPQLWADPAKGTMRPHESWGSSSSRAVLTCPAEALGPGASP